MTKYIWENLPPSSANFQPPIVQAVNIAGICVFLRGVNWNEGKDVLALHCLEGVK